MTQQQLSKVMQLRAKMELLFVDFQEFANEAQAEFQAEQKKEEPKKEAK